MADARRRPGHPYDLARDALAPGLADADVERLAKELTAIWTSLDFAGKGLAAAHASLPAPDDAIGRLWHAATILREYRGDCHVAILTAAGLDGAAANALAVADGRVRAQPARDARLDRGRVGRRLRASAPSRLDGRVRRHHRQRPGRPGADRGRHRSGLAPAASTRRRRPARSPSRTRWSPPPAPSRPRASMQFPNPVGVRAP